MIWEPSLYSIWHSKAYFLCNIRSIYSIRIIASLFQPFPIGRNFHKCGGKGRWLVCVRYSEQSVCVPCLSHMSVWTYRVSRKLRTLKGWNMIQISVIHALSGKYKHNNVQRNTHTHISSVLSCAKHLWALLRNCYVCSGPRLCGSATRTMRCESVCDFMKCQSCRCCARFSQGPHDILRSSISLLNIS